MEKKSSFQFKGYKVLRSFLEIKESTLEDLTLEFEPRGILNNTDNLFILEMKVRIFDKEQKINIDVTFEGEYEISERDDNLKPFLFTNAPAILFPYIRAYITSITALSGSAPIILPTMNLLKLKDKLAENLVEV